jgi:hypothetical protein
MGQTQIMSGKDSSGKSDLQCIRGGLFLGTACGRSDANSITRPSLRRLAP